MGGMDQPSPRRKAGHKARWGCGGEIPKKATRDRFEEHAGSGGESEESDVAKPRVMMEGEKNEGEGPGRTAQGRFLVQNGWTH